MVSNVQEVAPIELQVVGRTILISDVFAQQLALSSDEEGGWSTGKGPACSISG